MKRIGIPHGLFYFYYYPLWKTFFEDLGWEVITSSPSSRLTIEMGIDTAVDEACFPIKVYMGHIRELCRCRLDYLFVPRLVSIEERSFICPKFMGLPDMVRALVEEAPPLIDIVVDMSKSRKGFQDEMKRLGRLLAVKRRDWERAYQHGLQELEFCRALAREGYTMAEAIKIWEGQPAPTMPEADLNIGMLGHGYAIYDPGISMDMINRLRRMGSRVLLPERLERKAVEEQAATVPKRVFWTLGRSMLGSALHLDQREDVDGIIYVACFACGPDSIIGEIIERKIKNKPFMFLTIDEHTGEAGMLTRLEAFCDMLRRRRMSICDSDLSSHG
jgi:predicted nucleotide-binding protein (sugar kinase/HSP70/actin superfamily)